MTFSPHILPRRTASGLRLIIVAVYTIPLIYLVAASFKTAADLNASPAGLLFLPTLTNYADAFTPDIIRATGVTIVLATSTTAIVLGLGLPAAFAISRLRGRAYAVAIATLLVFQLVPAAATLIPQYRLLYQIGLLGTLPGVVLVLAAGALPFGVLLMVPFCRNIPSEVLDAAEVDGVGGFRLLVSIVLPLTRNAALVVGVLTFIVAWGDFLTPVTFLNSEALQPLSLTLLSNIGANITNYGTLTATAVLASLPLLVLYLFVQKRMREGLTAGSLK